MSDTSPKFRRETAEQRKDDLIQATLSLIAEHGVRGATVRAISKRADVTQGLIRHYFSTKEDLIAAAYEHHMGCMTELTSASTDFASLSPIERLSAFVAASLSPPVVDPSSVVVWASFLNKVREDERMQKMHEQTYYEFRDRLEGLIKATLEEADILVSTKDLRRMAIASNAVIDGLWLEGGALPTAFEPNELPEIGLESVGAIIGLKLKITAGSS
ncbi:TetR family transcriptional regulator C-terminal domain-containing protein [Aliiroseovarius sp. KMU-50]|uniref:TetR family transcriptional regulator C-terminal domain-containing protein n=1 Tax=Aliiroseovarius salicola TaxID=3009082 RepID=A0ABT4VZM0_9RHOB|nr:TetR family transcriptional regulator C-terminal domain-containing protein [Aliiroseovarius sp. KMU-50]MDA5093704.1 TetR family transcriptional regulator C-terminal domain-containing protein [Aliiroseovarius sp. KMU-50]